MSWPVQPGRPAWPTEGVIITTQYMPLSFMLALFKPKVLLDGYQGPPLLWGRNVIPVPPGQHRVHVHVPYWLPAQIGPADALVDIYPGQWVELEYKAPVWGFSPGSLGVPPQSYNGVGITVALIVTIMAVTFLFPLLLLLIGI